MPQHQFPSFPSPSLLARLLRFLGQVVALLPAVVFVSRVVVQGLRYGNIAHILPGRTPRRTYPAPRVPEHCREGSVVGNGGTKFHYLESGAVGGKQPAPRLLLLLHGFPEFSHSWRHVLAALGASSSFRVVAPDLRGYGSTDCDPAWPLTAYSLPVLVEDIRSLILALGHERACIVGHDWGGLLAWCFAAAHPALTDQLAILAVPHPRAFLLNMGPRQMLRSWYISVFQLPWIPEWYVRLRDFAFLQSALLGPRLGVRPSAQPLITAADVEAYKWAFSRPGRASACVNYYRNMFGVNLQSKEAAASPVLCDVLHVWGTLDAVLGEELLANTRQYVKGKYRVVRVESSHWVQQDAARETVRLLADFFGVLGADVGRIPQ